MREKEEIMLNQSTQSTNRLWIVLLPDIIYVAILPYIIYRLASPYMPATYALLLAGIPPAIRAVIKLVRRGQLDLLGTLSLLAIAIKLVSGLIFKDARLQLISDSMIIGVYGIIMLFSLLSSRPLLLSLAMNLSTNSSAAPDEKIKRRWQGAAYRSFFTNLTALWGGGLLIESVTRAILIYALPIEQFIVVNIFVRYSIFGLLLIFTYFLIRKRRSAAKEKSEQLPQEK